MLFFLSSSTMSDKDEKVEDETEGQLYNHKNDHEDVRGLTPPCTTLQAQQGQLYNHENDHEVQEDHIRKTKG